MNSEIDIDKLPPVASRAEWSRLINVPIEKLAYEQRYGRIKTLPRTGWMVMIEREAIILLD
jgi:hypothetical protein